MNYESLGKKSVFCFFEKMRTLLLTLAIIGVCYAGSCKEWAGIGFFHRQTKKKQIFKKKTFIEFESKLN